MIIDAHMHIWQRVHGQASGTTPVRPIADGRIQIGEQVIQGMPPYMHDCAARAETFIAEMDAAGVDRGVAVQEFVDGEQNDYSREAMTQHPDRLLCHALPNWWDPDRIETEAAALLEHGFHGLKIPAVHMRGRQRLDDARFMPVFERLERDSLVLAVDLAEGPDQAWEMENVLARCPRLKVALGHFGFPNRGGWPEQLRLGRHPNVYLDTGGIVWLYRHEGPPFPGAQAVIRQAIDELGASKLMWGSDWPRTMLDFTYRQSLDFVRQSDQFTDQEKQWLLGRSAAVLYAVPWQAEGRNPMPLMTEG
jgi:predicted TIM-barrel fold metal-dependent hydrolase